jgi:hypothetical protein
MRSYGAEGVQILWRSPGTTSLQATRDANIDYSRAISVPVSQSEQGSTTVPSGYPNAQVRAHNQGVRAAFQALEIPGGTPVPGGKSGVAAAR